MMNQVDKERIAASTGITLLLYAGLFLLTGWTDFLKPGEAVEYFGPVMVQVNLVPEPREILPPEPEPVVPEEAEIVPEPIPVEPEPITPEPVEPEPVAPEPVPAEIVPVESEPVTPVVIEPEPSNPITAEPAPALTESAIPESTPLPEAAPVKEIPEKSSDELVSAPRSDTGTQDFSAVDKNTVTDQFGKTSVEYGDETPTDLVSDAISATESEQAPSLFDFSQLDSALTTVGENGAQSDGTVSDGPANDVPESIEAATIEELHSKRGFVGDDPVLKAGSLPESIRSMKVQVKFTILANGIVQSVEVEDTGDTELNRVIETALRKWKFAPVRGDGQMTATLLYIITAEQ
ncbi:MAG: energy transducer TonB [Spirochaetales bacterium]|jgi:TonB family protein|nr:energy transducer TonB [Spirochaetales bacterium]